MTAVVNGRTRTPRFFFFTRKEKIERVEEESGSCTLYAHCLRGFDATVLSPGISLRASAPRLAETEKNIKSRKKQMHLRMTCVACLLINVFCLSPDESHHRPSRV